MLTLAATHSTGDDPMSPKPVLSQLDAGPSAVRGRLEGKVALISGAAMGMGTAHARVFVREGARVVLGDIADELGEKLAAELGENASFARLDVTDPGSWQAAVEHAETTFGPVTVLVNNAGVAGPASPTADLSLDAYHRTVDIDETGTYLGMRATIPGMVAAGGGSIVNVSSTAGFSFVLGTPNVAYAAAKFAVRGMTKAAAVEYGSAGVRVNSVHPGGVLTPMVAQGLDEAGRTAVTANIPLGRLAEPEEISHLVVFLASDEASYVTGAAFIADGGMLAR
jgi:3alpha(or 20beta)-hydroxysteroid dehydrogenase